MCDLDGEASTVTSESRVRARIEHWCCACGETIRVGDIYVRTGAFYDGWETFKHCLRCYTIFEALLREAEGPVAYRLDCGATWKDPPEELAALAFVTADEMQHKRGV